MGWFQEWWQGLGLVGQVMACAAIPMTVIMFLQLILMVIGADIGDDSDVDSGGGFDGDTGGDFSLDTDGSFDGDFSADIDGGFDGDFSADLDGGFDGDLDGGAPVLHSAAEHGDFAGSTPTLRIFTIRGIVAFFAIGGWAGLAALTAGIPTLWSIQIALVAGVAAMLLASFVLKLALQMQSSGNISLKYALSQVADVYITIPAARSDRGKITMVLQERFVELEAVTDSKTDIKPNTKVEVVGIVGNECLLVSPVAERAVDEEKTNT